jgi:hypothetical protein
VKGSKRDASEGLANESGGPKVQSAQRSLIAVELSEAWSKGGSDRLTGGAAERGKRGIPDGRPASSAPSSGHDSPLIATV